MNVLSVLAEAMSLIEPGIKITQSLAAIFQKGRELAESPPADDSSELADLRSKIEEQRAILSENTRKIEED